MGSPKPHPLEGRLEPEASSASSPQEAAALSLAISMKRIADCLDGTALGVDVSGSVSSPMAWRDVISDAVRS